MLLMHVWLLLNLLMALKSRTQPEPDICHYTGDVRDVKVKHWPKRSRPTLERHTMWLIPHVILASVITEPDGGESKERADY